MTCPLSLLFSHTYGEHAHPHARRLSQGLDARGDGGTCSHYIVYYQQVLVFERRGLGMETEGTYHVLAATMHGLACLTLLEMPAHEHMVEDGKSGNSTYALGYLPALVVTTLALTALAQRHWHDGIHAFKEVVSRHFARHPGAEYLSTSG